MRDLSDFDIKFKCERCSVVRPAKLNEGTPGAIKVFAGICPCYENIEETVEEVEEMVVEEAVEEMEIPREEVIPLIFTKFQKNCFRLPMASFMMRYFAGGFLKKKIFRVSPTPRTPLLKRYFLQKNQKIFRLL